MRHPLLDIIERFTVISQGRMFAFIFNRTDVQFEVHTLNTEHQLAFGKYASGGELPDYSDASIEIFGKPDGPIILRDTGAFWESLQEKSVSETEYTWTADGQKEDKNLFEEYGADILGLTEESKDKLLPLIKEYAEEFIRSEFKF